MEKTSGFRMKIRGPLYQGETSLSTIRIEISRRENLLLATHRIEISPLYPDVIPYFIETMSPEEIAAEKVRAILTRDKPRDLYDYYFLMKRNIKLSLEHINQKLEYYGLEFNGNDFIKKCMSFEKHWDSELKPLVLNVPKFQIVLENTRKQINRLGQ